MDGTVRSAPIHAPPLLESLGLLERAVGYARVTLGDVTPAMLHHPTPCHRWDLAALLDHMVDSLTALTEAADLGSVALRVPLGEPAPVDTVQRLRVQACSLLGAWSAEARHTGDTAGDMAGDMAGDTAGDTAGGLPGVMVGDRHLASSLLACAGALEVAVHGWDVGQATGARRPLPTMLALELLPWVGIFVTERDRPSRFAAALDVPLSGPSTQLLARVGRRA
ncbi:MAG TPA: hypothetical protein VFK41_02885 [Nocardioidaceae bacterium]|nr:hypothetical protein [Nocardioidaceae bacterium]